MRSTVSPQDAAPFFKTQTAYKLNATLASKAVSAH